MIREQFGKLNFLREFNKRGQFSFARTMNRFPSSRCASTIQIVCPLESITETQPQLQPALLKLSVRPLRSRSPRRFR